MRNRQFTVVGKAHNADQWASFMMLGAFMAALLWVNSPLKSTYDLLHHTPAMVSIGSYSIQKPLVFWVNEGLMTFFFLAVTLEIKREILEGHLSDVHQMLLPVFAAIGGMVVPAALYLLIAGNNPELIYGWAIPTATDIALSLGILSLLGKRVPIELKLFLAALAIFDDLGGILIIALFFGGEFALNAFLLSTLGIAVLAVLNRCGVNRASPYIVVGLFLWVALQESGIHPTMAGVAIALSLPLSLRKVCVNAPLRFVEEGLFPWVALLIVPLFTFANSGVVLSNLSPDRFASPLALAVIAGLVFGKPLGIFIFAWLAHLFGFANLAAHVNWRLIFGVSLLGGMGFTMALFLNSQAFPENSSLEVGRMAIFSGSLFSGVAGYFWLRLNLPISKPDPSYGRS